MFVWHISLCYFGHVASPNSLIRTGNDTAIVEQLVAKFGLLAPEMQRLPRFCPRYNIA